MDTDYSPTPSTKFAFALAKKIASEVTIELGQNGLDEDQIEMKNQMDNEDGSHSSAGSAKSPAPNQENSSPKTPVVVPEDVFADDS